MILHDFPLSSACFRVRIVLSLKRLTYEKRNYALRAGEQRGSEYLAVNPAGLVPALEAGGIVLGQSLAIIDYLDAIYPEPRMIPADPIARHITVHYSDSITVTGITVHYSDSITVTVHLIHSLATIPL